MHVASSPSNVKQTPILAAGKTRRQCGAQTRAGTPCKNAPMANGRCRMHGGKSLAGVASPAFKHGRHSAYLPQPLADRYKAILADPDHLSLQAEIALLDTLIAQTVEGLETGESEQLWGQVQGTWADLAEAMRSNDRKEIKTLAKRMTTLFALASQTQTAWTQILSLLERRRQLVGTEQQILVKTGQMLDVQSVLTIFTAAAEDLREIVQREAPERAGEILSAHARSMQRLIGRGQRVS